MRQYFTFILALFAFTHYSYSQMKPVEIPLYSENKVPGNIEGADEEKSETINNILRIGKVRIPTLTAFLPPAQKANGTAIVICPGGGYSIVAIDHEGYSVARKLNEMGVAAFVLKYRIPDKKNQEDPSMAPLQDAQQAIIIVRKNAKKWNVDPERVGIMGFSAGGHLASTAGTHFKQHIADLTGTMNVRPDFMVLIYPVISTEPGISHKGSFKNLLGDNASAVKLNYFSNEKQVDSDTPPTFLVHASDDPAVKPDNSIVFYQALVKNRVPAEIHIYQNGGHGFGLNNFTTKDEWMERCKNWLDTNGWLKNK